MHIEIRVLAYTPADMYILIAIIMVNMVIHLIISPLVMMIFLIIIIILTLLFYARKASTF